MVGGKGSRDLGGGGGGGEDSKVFLGGEERLRGDSGLEGYKGVFGPRGLGGESDGTSVVGIDIT